MHGIEWNHDITHAMSYVMILFDSMHGNGTKLLFTSQCKITETIHVNEKEAWMSWLHVRNSMKICWSYSSIHGNAWNYYQFGLGYWFFKHFSRNLNNALRWRYYLICSMKQLYNLTVAPTSCMLDCFRISWHSFWTNLRHGWINQSATSCKIPNLIPSF